MADVTISQLTKGTPTGNSILPYSTGSNTLGVPVSAIFQNTSNLLIGTEYMPGYTSNRLSVNGGILIDGDISFAQDLKAYFIRVPTNGGAIRLRGNAATGVDRRLQLGIIDNNGTWTPKITVGDDSIVMSGYIINNSGILFDNTEKIANVKDTGINGSKGISNFNVLVQPSTWTTIATTPWGGQALAAFITEPTTTYNLQGFHIVPHSYGGSNNIRSPSYSDNFVNAGGWTQYNIQWRSQNYNLQVYHTGPVPIRFWGTFSGV